MALLMEKKINILLEVISSSDYKNKQELISKNLDTLSKHQSNWFIQKFSSIIPKSLQYSIQELVKSEFYLKNKTGFDKGEFNQLCNNKLKEILTEYLSTSLNNKNKNFIENILSAVKKNKINWDSPTIFSQYFKDSRYTSYSKTIKTNSFGNFFKFDNFDFFKYSNGDIFKGIFNSEEFKTEEPFRGELKYANGDVFIGEFKDGKPYYGIRKYTNGDIFNGTFNSEVYKTEEPSCGELKYANGDEFDGEFKYGKPCFGRIKYANGDIFIGGFKNGKPTNFGTYTKYKQTKTKAPSEDTSIKVDNKSKFNDLLKDNCDKHIFFKKLLNKISTNKTNPISADQRKELDKQFSKVLSFSDFMQKFHPDKNENRHLATLITQEFQNVLEEVIADKIVD